MPLFRSVQQLYGDALVNDLATTKAQLSDLKSQTWQASHDASLEVESIQRETDETIARMFAAAEIELNQIERERRRMRERHFEALREIEERDLLERRALDSRIEEAEETLRNVHADGDEQLAAIQRRRESELMAARGRIEAAELRGEERIRQSHALEASLLKSTQKDIKRMEEHTSWLAQQEEARCDATCRHHEEAVLRMQQEYSSHIDDLLSQMAASRRSLLESRKSADERLAQQLAAIKETTRTAILEASRDLTVAREELHVAVESSNASARALQAERKAAIDVLAREVHACAGEVQDFIDHMPWSRRLAEEDYVEGLQHLVANLQSATFLTPAPSSG